MNISFIENIKFLANKNIFDSLNSLTNEDFHILHNKLNLDLYKVKFMSSFARRKFISKLKSGKSQNYLLQKNTKDTTIHKELKNCLIQAVVSMILSTIDKNTFIFKQNFLDTNETLNTHKFDANDVNFSIYMNQGIIDELNFLLYEDVGIFFQAYQQYTIANLQNFIVGFIKYKIIKMQTFEAYLFDNFDYYFNLKCNKKYFLNSKYKSELINEHKKNQSTNSVYQDIKTENMYYDSTNYGTFFLLP